MSKVFKSDVPTYKILVLTTSSNSEGSDKTAHMRRLSRAFAAHIHKVWMKMKTQIKNIPLAPLNTQIWLL